MAGKSNKGALRLLRLQGQVWWFKRDVPADCQTIYGKNVWMENLATSDVRVAKERRDELEDETRRAFAEMRLGRWSKGQGLSPADRGALWREQIVPLSEARKGLNEKTTPTLEERKLGWDLTPEEMAPDDLELAVFAAEAERDNLRGAERAAFESALSGHVPVERHLDDYLKAAKISESYKKARRGLINMFARWCADENLMLDKITRREAGRYVTAKIDPMHPKTGSQHLLALRQYWLFLAARGHVSGDDEIVKPWTGQVLQDKGRRVERGSRDVERPFSEEEVRALLYSPFPPKMDAAHASQIVDALTISLLTGMRLEEILTLWVEEVRDGVFDIQQGKTDAAARKVPMHPALREIVKRRTEGKAPTDWLFHELSNERDPSDTFGKRFRRYRLHLGVDDKREGKRRSLVNFHSARRWFITSARHRGQPKETIQDVVGHRPDKKDVTFGIYTPGASPEQWRACVAAVQLPSASGVDRAVEA